MSTITTTPKQQLTIRDRLASPELRQAIEQALPSHMTAGRMLRVALNALNRTPKLSECTQSSFFKCLIDLSAWGLEPDGRRAHLIPYGKECTLILDYKGIVELAMRSGFVNNIHSSVVFAGDKFEVKLGKVVSHTPWDFLPVDMRPGEKGEVIAAYCIVEMKGDSEHHEVMTVGEIEDIRKRSRAGNNGPWKTDWNEMARKTVFRRASKWLPLSAEQHDAAERDFDSFAPIEANKVSRVSSVGIEELLNDSDSGTGTDGRLFAEPPSQTTAPEDE